MPTTEISQADLWREVDRLKKMDEYYGRPTNHQRNVNVATTILRRRLTQSAGGSNTSSRPASPPAANTPTSDSGTGNGRGNNATAASVANLLTDYGLEVLIPTVDRWIRDGLSVDEVMLQLRDPNTSAGKMFDERFPAIRLRTANGLAPISPAEYVAYERSARQVMSAAGLPDGFWNSHEDFTNLLTGDVSVAELSTRINAGYVEVANAPAEVRAAFNDFFGPNGDAALASFFLDSEKALPLLQEYVDTAKVAGAGRQFGISVDAARANRIRETGVGFDQARGGFSNLSDLQSVFDETISERDDLTAAGEGVDAVFALDQGQAKKKVEGRLAERGAAFAGSGGAAASERGVFGLGTAKR